MLTCPFASSLLNMGVYMHLSSCRGASSQRFITSCRILWRWRHEQWLKPHLGSHMLKIVLVVHLSRLHQKNCLSHTSFSLLVQALIWFAVNSSIVTRCHFSTYQAGSHVAHDYAGSSDTFQTALMCMGVSSSVDQDCNCLDNSSRHISSFWEFPC